MFLKQFISKNQLPGLSVSGTLVENGLKSQKKTKSGDIFGKRLGDYVRKGLVDSESVEEFGTMVVEIKKDKV